VGHTLAAHHAVADLAVNVGCVALAASQGLKVTSDFGARGQCVAEYDFHL
jgi:hypothetical protein